MSFDQITVKRAAGPAGGPLWLPGGAAATVTVEPDSERDASGGAGGHAVLTLHWPRHGAVEMRLRLDAGGVRAAVTTPPGPMSDRAAATLPDLVAGLERATGRPGIATVQARRGSRPGPTPPEGAYDGDA